MSAPCDLNVTPTSSPVTAEMRRHRPKVLVIASLPPPAIGPSIAMQRLLQDENLRDVFEFIVLDISDRRPPDNVGKFDLHNAWLAISHITQCFVVLVLRRPPILYLNISQGIWGYLRDMGFVIPALL